MLHPPGTAPEMTARGLTAKPGSDTTLQYQLTMRQLLGEPYDSCVMGPQLESQYIYSVAACKSICLERKILEECGCVDPTLLGDSQDMSNDTTYCVNINLPYQQMLHYILCAKRARELAYPECAASCSQQCNTPRYTATLSQTLWPTNPFTSLFYQTMIEDRPYKEKYEDI